MLRGLEQQTRPSCLFGSAVVAREGPHSWASLAPQHHLSGLRCDPVVVNKAVPPPVQVTNVNAQIIAAEIINAS